MIGWKAEPDDRPTFNEIKVKLDSMFGDRGGSVQEEVEKTLTIERGMSLDPDSDAAQGRIPPSVYAFKLSI